MRVAAALAFVFLAGCSAKPDVYLRGGLWEVHSAFVDAVIPGMPEAERRAKVAAWRGEALSVTDAPECRPDRTAANWLKPGAPASGYGGMTCRYTRVEPPGQPVDRLVECHHADGTRGPATHTTGTMSPDAYDLSIETASPDGERVYTRETGKRIGACPSRS